MTIMIKTGRCGSGKTLHSMVLIEKYLQEGRSVYTNIRGISINGVIKVSDDFEWWTMPEFAVLILDEVQNSIYYQKDHWRKLNDVEKAHRAKILSRLNTHRHNFKIENGDEWDQEGNYTLIFMTQEISALDNNLKIAEIHQHFHCPKKMFYSYIYEWDKYQANPDARTNKLMATRSTFIFRNHKKLYKYYDSISSAAADKTRLPLSIILVLLLPIIFLGYGLKGILFDDSLRKNSDSPSTAGEHVASVAQPVVTSTSSSAPVYISMCSATYPMSADGCLCKDGDVVLDLTIDRCYFYAETSSRWSVRPRQQFPQATPVAGLSDATGVRNDSPATGVAPLDTSLLSAAL